jgi:Xaa-Pro aminopeptidase
MWRKEYTMNKRIAFILKNMKNNSIGLIFSGEKIIKSSDQFFPFQVNKNFHYLTGLNIPNQLLVLVKTTETSVLLFAEKRSALKEKWDGSLPSFDSLLKKTNILTIKDIKTVDEYLKNLFLSNPNISNLYLEKKSQIFMNSFENKLISNIQSQYILKTNHDYNNLFKDMRTIKEEKEIHKIKKAIDISKSIFQNILNNLKSIKGENELHGLVLDQLHKNHSNEAFETIVASGKNALTLHYVENSDDFKGNELVLIDFGSTYDEYNSDITRTVPVNGTFSERQKILYDIVLSVNKDIIKWVKPGISLLEFKEKGKTLLSKKLLENKIISKLEDVSEYYYHGLGHHLGLDVHDVCNNEMIIKPGMVLTVEPGIYIKEESIGIRIEDDILITEEGSINLSERIPKERKILEELINR